MKFSAFLEPPVARAWGEVLAFGVIVAYVIRLQGFTGFTVALLALAFAAVAWGNSIYVIKKVFGMIGSFEEAGNKKKGGMDRCAKNRVLKEDSQHLGLKEQLTASQ